MGEYFMLVNHQLKEYISPRHCHLANKEWVWATHGLLVTWIMQHSHWYNTPCQIVGDEKNPDEWDKVEATYKDVEIEMLEGFNTFIKQREGGEHLVIEIDYRNPIE